MVMPESIDSVLGASEGDPVEPTLDELQKMAETDARRQLAVVSGQLTVVPLAHELGLYVEMPWGSGDEKITLKTTYSTQSEENAD